MPVKNSHVHKFKRLKYKTGNTIFFCTLPDCSVKINTALALGKKCVCWRCGEDFIMNEYSLRLAKPHCMKCHKTKDDIKDNVIIRDIIMDDVIESSAGQSVSLAERLSNTIKQAEKEADEEI